MTLFAIDLCEGTLKLGTDRISEQGEAQIVRVHAVNRTHILVWAAEDRGPVNVVDIRISVGACGTVGIDDDVAAQNVLPVGRVKVVAGEHDIGDGGVCMADRAVETLVRSTQVGDVGGVMVVIRYEGAHGEGGEIRRDRLFSVSGSRETEIQVIKTRAPCKDVLIAVSRAGRTGALRDRASVIHDGGHPSIRHPSAERSIAAYADEKRGYIRIGGKVDREMAQAAGGKANRRFIAILHIAWWDEGAPKTGEPRSRVVNVEVEARRTCQRHMSERVTDHGHQCTDRNHVRVGREADAPTRRIAVQGGDLFADRVRYHVGESLKGRFMHRVVEPVEGKGGLTDIAPNNIRI